MSFNDILGSILFVIAILAAAFLLVSGFNLIRAIHFPKPINFIEVIGRVKGKSIQPRSFQLYVQVTSDGKETKVVNCTEQLFNEVQTGDLIVMQAEQEEGSEVFYLTAALRKR